MGEGREEERGLKEEEGGTWRGLKGGRKEGRGGRGMNFTQTIESHKCC